MLANTIMIRTTTRVTIVLMSSAILLYAIFIRSSTSFLTVFKISEMFIIARKFIIMIIDSSNSTQFTQKPCLKFRINTKKIKIDVLLYKIILKPYAEFLRTCKSCYVNLPRGKFLPNMKRNAFFVSRGRHCCQSAALVAKAPDSSI